MNGEGRNKWSMKFSFLLLLLLLLLRQMLCLFVFLLLLVIFLLSSDRDGTERVCHYCFCFSIAGPTHMHTLTHTKKHTAAVIAAAAAAAAAAVEDAEKHSQTHTHIFCYSNRRHEKTMIDKVLVLGKEAGKGKSGLE